LCTIGQVKCDDDNKLNIPTKTVVIPYKCKLITKDITDQLGYISTANFNEYTDNTFTTLNELIGNISNCIKYEFEECIESIILCCMKEIE